jgi:hypothetical protein
MPGKARGVPATTAFDRSLWHNLRKVITLSPMKTLASAEEISGVSAFLAEFGVAVPPMGMLEQAGDPLTLLRTHLGRKAPGSPSRFCDGSFRAVYMGDDAETCFAEVGFHLERTLAETGAEKGLVHYFQLSAFKLSSTVQDVRKGHRDLHDPDAWGPAQSFGGKAHEEGASGITYRSVRRAKAMNTVVFKPDLAVSGKKHMLVGLGWTGAQVVRI